MYYVSCPLISDRQRAASRSTYRRLRLRYFLISNPRRNKLEAWCTEQYFLQNALHNHLPYPEKTCISKLLLYSKLFRRRTNNQHLYQWNSGICTWTCFLEQFLCRTWRIAVTNVKDRYSQLFTFYKTLFSFADLNRLPASNATFVSILILAAPTIICKSVQRKI